MEGDRRLGSFEANFECPAAPDEKKNNLHRKNIAQGRGSKEKRAGALLDLVRGKSRSDPSVERA